MKFNTIIEEIPASMAEECAKKGVVERIDYKTTNYLKEPEDKYAFVYVPNGYDPAKAYEIMYLIHGGGETAEKYLYQDGEANPLKKAVDHLMAEGTIQPSLIVTPSWYPKNTVDRGPDHRMLTENFRREIYDLMVAVESKYHTYAKTADDAGFTASREHRAVGGWSMGCCTTWWVFSEHIAWFNRFGHMSCDSWIVEKDGGRSKSEETAETLANCAREQGYSKKDFSSYIITGTKDFTFPNVALQAGAMLAFPDIWKFDGEDQNAIFLCWKDGEHHTPWRLQYSYNLIKNFLK